MSRLFGSIIAVVLVLSLAGCKSPQEKSATSSRFATQLQSLESTVATLQVSDATDSAAQRLAEACARLSLLTNATDNAACSGLISLGALSLEPRATQLATERDALKSYAEEADRKLLSQSVLEQVEAARRSLIASTAVRHWQWAESVSLKVSRFEAATKASVTIDIPEDFSLAALGKNYRGILSTRLERERAILARFGRPDDDGLYEKTLENIARWRERVERSEAILGKMPPLRAEIVTLADNKAWDSSLAKNAPASASEDLKRLDVDLTQPNNPIFEGFLQRAAAVNDLRSRTEILSKIDISTAPSLSTSAAEQLIDDCRSLLILDERSADQICGAASGALESALDLVRPSTSRDDSSSGNRPTSGPGGPSLDPGGPSTNDLQIIRLSEGLKARLRVETAAAPVAPPDRAGPSSQAVTAHVAALKAHINAISRAHAQASIHGYFTGLAEHETQLEFIHETMRVAAGGLLPERLRDPLALLSQPSAEAALQDAQRLKRIVSRNLTLVPDAPELLISEQTLGERISKLEKILSAPPTQADLASVVRSIDPEKANALLSEMPSKIDGLVEKRKKTWAEKFVGLAGGFDTWRGPRGPPPPDPKFPRSQRVLAAVKMLGANPTEAVQAFSALKAEHAEFYREAGRWNDNLTKSWDFGRKDARAWMVGLLSPRDLAVAASVLKEAQRVPPTLKITEGWSELADAAERLQEAVNAEAKLRLETSGRHPPGYPPGRRPAIVSVAKRYTEEWNKRPVGRLEQQIRLQTAKLMYPDSTTMPAALRNEVRTIANGALDEDMTRLAALLSSLYGDSGRDGLLDRAARSVNKLPDTEMAALVAAKDKAIRAAEIISQRVGDAEADKLIEHDKARWSRIDGWFRRFGRGPPSAALPVPAPKPLTPLGSGGANFLFTSSELERTFVEITDALQGAERSLKVAEVVATRSVKPAPIGAEKGRAVGNRLSWSNGNFSFGRMMNESADSALTRYPEGLRDWEGFFQKDGRPFEFDRYVKNFTNFRGVGGGIHFGEMAKPLSETAEAVAEGGLLTYDDTNQTIKLSLPSGASYSYGPVPPRVLKALYAYATAYPGINLAVTIGATGDRKFVRDQSGAPVLLDPTFVDNPVGQDLYLADIIPWSLDKPLLPNGNANAATEEFSGANRTVQDEQRLLEGKIVDLVGNVEPLRVLDGSKLRGMLGEDSPTAAFLVATALSTSADQFKKVYQTELVDAAVKQYRSSGALEKDLSVMRRYDDKLRGSDLSRPKKRKSLEDMFQEELGTTKIEELEILGRLSGRDEELRSALVSDYKKKAVDSARQRSAKLVESIEFLKTEPNRARRALYGVLLARERDDVKNEIHIPKGLMRLASAAIKDLAEKERSPSDAKTIAQQLPGTLCTSFGLSTLFDEHVSFALRGNQLLIVPKMQYRYAVSSIQVTLSGLTCYLDGTDSEKPIKAKHLSHLGAAANANLDQIAKAYPPLARVIEYAGIVAFLRWAACPTTINQSCRGRDELTIDFSALGRYDLRDRERTPTPDMDAR